MIRAVLLDLDGTLIDSNDAHARAWVEALNEENLKSEYGRVRKMIGMGGDHLLPIVSGLSDESELGKRISQRRGEIFRSRYLPHLKAFPGARELLEKILEHGMDLVVATSASKEDLKAILEQAGIADLIHKATDADDAESSKPDPDLISTALQKTDATPQEAVLLGDTPYDIKAAAKAGVRTIAFTCGGWGIHDLNDAIAIYEGPWQLLQEYDQSALSGNLTKQIRVGSSRPEIGQVPIY